MTDDDAENLYRTGRAHAGAACLLYAAAVAHVANEGEADPAEHVFNGPNSLSIMHLLGLGLELMLKAAIRNLDPGVDEKFLKFEIGHDLVEALQQAEKRGFTSSASYLPEVIALLQDPYNKHWFRYGRPEQFALPGDFDQIVEMLEGLEAELGPKFGAPVREAE